MRERLRKLYMVPFMDGEVPIWWFLLPPVLYLAAWFGIGFVFLWCAKAIGLA
jgi:hypothetical protein